MQYMTSLVGILVFSLNSSSVFACSTSERVDLAKAGYTKTEIESMCKGGSRPESSSKVKFDYQGSWRVTECQIKEKSTGNFSTIPWSVCNPVRGQTPFGTKIFSLGKNFFNKQFKISVFQEDDFLIIQADEPRLGWPVSAQIIDDNRLRTKSFGMDTYPLLYGPSDKKGGEAIYMVYTREGKGMPTDGKGNTVSTTGSAKASPVEPYIGLWKRSSCEYWRNGSRLDVPCTPKNEDFLVEFKSTTFRFGKKEGDIEYSDAGQGAVDVRNTSGETLRFFKESYETIFLFLPDTKNDREMRINLSKVNTGPASQMADPNSSPPVQSKEKIVIDESKGGDLYTMTASIDVIAEPNPQSKKIATYQTGAIFATIGEAVGTGFLYVSPCNVCAKGYVKKTEFLSKAKR